MRKAATLCTFCILLVGCVALDVSIVFALLAGLFLFLFYGKSQGLSWRALTGMAFSGMWAVKNILLVFLLIGMLTALWRASGTIAAIICYSAGLMRSSLFLPAVFLLNCAVSVLMGTSFGSAATMGAVCMTMGRAMGMDPVLVGGAVLSGVYFGDRCSPVSTSALLVSQLTQTNIFSNIRRMCRTAALPFGLCCVIYALLGMFFGRGQEACGVEALFYRNFVIDWENLLPAAAILALSFFRVNVKLTMAVSIGLAAANCVLIQPHEAKMLLPLLFFGYQSPDPELAAMMNGGGIFSMLHVSAVVLISSSYAGIFRGTGLLEGITEHLDRLAGRLTAYGVTLTAAVFVSLIACNQTLTILLTHQLMGRGKRGEEMAIDLEDSAVVVAPMVPWSIAGAVPLASIGAPLSSICFACFLYLLPLWRLSADLLKKRK